MKNISEFPPLPLQEWKSTKQTLHLFAQILGKIRMTLTPPQNHWWHVPLFVNTYGLGTGPIPYGDQRFEINFNFRDHRLNVVSSLGKQRSFELHNGLTVSTFYNSLFEILSDLDINAHILAKPYDQPVPDPIPFVDDKVHKSYNKDYVERYWFILMQVDRIFRVFNQTFCGKVCPVQLYWHSFDLAVTRFSGKTAPPMPEAGRVDREAYSHEVISFGFWPGDENIPNPAFYSYTFPAPEGLNKKPLQPATAHWVNQNGSPLAILMYEDMRSAKNPGKILLSFLESAYRAGVTTANWDTGPLQHETSLSESN